MLKLLTALDLAMSTYGPTLQKIVCLEEMSELTKEISKDIRGKGNLKNIVEELADVEIMVEQMIRYYDVNDSVRGAKDSKLERLRRRLMEDIKK